MLVILALSACARAAPAEDRAASGGVRADLYACEGCEIVDQPDRDTLSWSMRIGGESEAGDPLVVEGTVFLPDGKTPASDVVIFAHQTDDTGICPEAFDDRGRQLRQGRLHGWVKTGLDGRYRFETIKPAPYPSMTMPAHIHLYIGEAGRRPYYIDDVVFAGEFGVDDAYIAAQELRGGSGIIELTRDSDGVLHARRDIVLEKHPS